MKNFVQIFKGSINIIQEEINNWAIQNNVTILNTSLTYDEGAGMGYVFVIVVYERATPLTPSEMDRP